MTLTKLADIPVSCYGHKTLNFSKCLICDSDHSLADDVETNDETVSELWSEGISKAKR